MYGFESMPATKQNISNKGNHFKFVAFRIKIISIGAFDKPKFRGEII